VPSHQLRRVVEQRRRWRPRRRQQIHYFVVELQECQMDLGHDEVFVVPMVTDQRYAVACSLEIVRQRWNGCALRVTGR
jgi:hypothetical protein